MALRLLAVAALLTGAACSTGSQPVAVSSTPSATTTTTKTATVAQYASIVSRQKAAIGTLPHELQQECNLSGSGPVTLICQTKILTLHYSAETLSMALDGARKEGVPAYIGAPPAEIRNLVQETIGTASEVGREAREAHQCVTTGGTCGTAMLLFRTDLPDLDQQFAAWRPYGVT